MISKKKITELARHVYKTLGPCHAELDEHTLGVLDAMKKFL